MQRSYSPSSPYMNTSYAGYTYAGSARKGSFLNKFGKIPKTLTMIGVVLLVLTIIGYIMKYQKSSAVYRSMPRSVKEVYVDNGDLLFWGPLIATVLCIGAAMHKLDMFEGILGK